MVSRKNCGLFFRVYGESLKPGDLVKWTFAKTSPTFNKENKFHMGILLHPEKVPINSWSILLSDGKIVHADETEIEVIRESEDR